MTDQRSAMLYQHASSAPPLGQESVLEENLELRGILASYEAQVDKHEVHLTHERSKEVIRALELRRALESEAENWRKREESEIVARSRAEAETETRIQLNKLEALLESADFERKKQSKVIEALRATLKRVEAELLESTRKVEELEVEVETLRSNSDYIGPDQRLTLLTAELVALKEDRQTLLARFTAMEELAATKDQEIVNLRLRLGESEHFRVSEQRANDSKHRNQASDILRLQNECADLQIKLVRAEARQRELEEENLSNADLAAREKNNLEEVMRSQIKQMGQKVHQLEKELTILTDENDNLKNELEQKTRAAESFREKLIDAEAQLDYIGAKPDSEVLRDELRVTRDRLTIAQRHLAVKSSLERSLNATQTENARIRSELSSMVVRSKQSDEFRTPVSPSIAAPQISRLIRGIMSVGRGRLLDPRKVAVTSPYGEEVILEALGTLPLTANQGQFRCNGNTLRLYFRNGDLLVDADRDTALPFGTWLHNLS